MDLDSSHRLARNLFPESPVRFHSYNCNDDGFSSDPDTIGPMSPLSSPDKPAQKHVFDKLLSPSTRRSPRIARRIISPTTKLSDYEFVEETPAKLFTTNFDLEKALAQRVVVEESPDISNVTPKNMKPASKESSKENSFYSPSTGINCGSFYQKPKARLSLFADFISKKDTADGRKKRTRSISADSVIPKKTNPHKRLRIAPVNKNVRHGIKKPRGKAVINKVTKNPLNITPAKKVPLISPTDRLEVFMEDLDMDEIMAEIKANQNTSKTNARSNIKKVVPKSKPKPVSINHNVPEKVFSSPKSDPSKKFFKTNRTMEINRLATVTLDKNIKFQVSNGKITLHKPEAKVGKNPLKTRKFTAELMDFESLDKDEAEKKVQKKVENILSQLCNGKENDIDANNIVLSPGLNMAAITSSTSKISIEDNGFATSTPSRPTETAVIESGSVDDGSFLPATPITSASQDSSLDASCSAKGSKLFPLFYKGNSPQESALLKSVRRSPRGLKRQWQPISENQYQIDAGQRHFGATQCKDCGLCYQMGEPDDEMQHEEFHNNDRSLKYMAWKNERVVNTYDTGRVIAVHPGDLKSWWNKVVQVLEVVDKALGCPPLEHDLESSKVYMFIHGNRVVGCLACKPLQLGYKLLDTVSEIDLCSEESYPVAVGVSRIWTAESWRRKKVASRLLDCMRSNSVFGKVLAKEEVAFSVPTVVGKSFAMSYNKSSELLVYFA